MMPDSSQYINLLNNKPEFITTSSLKEMEYKETMWGVIDGAGLGCLTIGAAGALIPLPFIDHHDPYSGITVVLMAILGATIGFIGGGIWGGIHQSTIILDLRQHQNSK
jgi:hypothetical protein